MIMTWQLAADWASTIGAFLLTVGTGAQAYSNLIEYRDLRQIASNATKQELRIWTNSKMMMGGRGRSHGLLPLLLLLLLIVALSEIPRKMIQLQGAAEGGKEAARILQLTRLVIVWTILFMGSLLVLAASCIQLAVT